MHGKYLLAILMLTVGLIAAACVPIPRATPAPAAGMPNPAAVFCAENGGEVDLRTDATGAVAGFCVFPDGSECEEWAYLRKECAPGDSLTTPAAGMPNPASVFCEENGGMLELRMNHAGAVTGVCVFSDGSECDEWAYSRGECAPGEGLVTPEATPEPAAAEGWRSYRNEMLGYSFEYPADAAITEADEPLKSLSITGPLVADDHWPMIFIAHPADRAEFRPPEGTDLAAWLSEHDLLGGDLHGLQDVQIAGTDAIHTRRARSPQAYADDRYYFAHAGQLYQIVIVHTGDKEDWTLYNRFLDSFRFEP